MPMMDVHQVIVALRCQPRLVLTGREINGDCVQVASLGCGYEVQILPRSGPVQHRCFINSETLLAWYVVRYIVQGVCDA